MECPQDNVDMTELTTGEDQTIHRCPQCSGTWIDVADLNRLLLHHNLAGLESMGGRANIDTLAGQCPVDNVDLVVIEGGKKSDPMRYDSCEVCGGLWMDADSGVEGETADEVRDQLVEFFRDFARQSSHRA